MTWDARCSGIYIGFAIGVLYQAATSRALHNFLFVNLLLVNTLFLLPLLVDVFTVSCSLRAPSNDIKYLTGLLFGGAFSIYLFQAFMILIRTNGVGCRTMDQLRFFAPLLTIIVAAFFLKEWDNVIVYGVLEALCITGFLSLAGILLVGLFLSSKDICFKKAS